MTDVMTGDTATTSPILSVRGAAKAYRGAKVVQDASLGLFSGRITCLLGPSGCGKSTLLRLIAGLEKLDAGEIECAGRTLSSASVHAAPEARGIGLVFQELALFPHLTAAQNVAFGLSGLSRAERRTRAIELLDQFQLGHRADAWPHMLSGGEQQRVAIARALAVRPAVLLLDEPFSGLDGALKADVRASVLSGLRKAQAAVLVVTHDPDEAMLVGDELVLMSGGFILQSGAPEACYLRPTSLGAAKLLGEARTIPARVTGGLAETPFGTTPADGVADGPATTMLRPESLELASAGSPGSVQVDVTETRFAGAFHELKVAAGEHVAIVRASAPPAGTSISVRLRSGHTVTWSDAGTG